MTFSHMKNVQLGMQHRFSLRESDNLNIVRFSQRKISNFYYFIRYMKPLSQSQSATKQSEPNEKTNEVIKQPKSHRSRYLQQPWGFTISNHKKIQLQRLRQMEMERENKSLSNRIKDIGKKRRNSLHNQLQSIYLKQTLHAGVRKEHNRIRLEQNEGHKKRIQNLTAIVNVKKLEKEQESRQSFKKILQKHYASQNKPRIRSIDFNKIEYLKVNEEKALRYCRDRVFNGVKILVKIQEFNSVFLVTGLIRDRNLSMFMVIEKERINKFLGSECKGKIQNFGNLLKFDFQTNSLYYMPEQAAKGECFITDKSSEFQIKQLRIQFRRQSIQVQRRQHKKEKSVSKEQVKTEEKKELSQQQKSKTKEGTNNV